MRLGCLLLFGTVALLWAGGQGFYQAVTNRTPTMLTCADLEKAPAKAAWVRVTGCTGSLIDSSYKKKYSSVTEIFIPVHTKGGSETAHLVVATEDPSLLAVAKRMSEADAKSDTKAMLSFLAENAKALQYDQEIEGMVRSGFDSDDKVLKHLRERKKGLAADFVVLDQGKKPGMIKSGLMLGGGVLLGVACIALFASKSSS
jgi:hypothetical protein